MQGKITEIFKSIQGEGLYQGIDQIFIRFFGCNLRCAFCDTSLESYKEMSLDDVVRKIKEFSGYSSISLTGGEPLLQDAFLESLVRILKDRGNTLYLETNGTLPEQYKRISDCIDIVSLDFKLPSSTRLKDYWHKHREFLRLASKKDVFVKAIITKTTHIEDLRIAAAIIKEIKKEIPLILQPENLYEDVLGVKLEHFQRVYKRIIPNIEIRHQLHKKLGIK